MIDTTVDKTGLSIKFLSMRLFFLLIKRSYTIKKGKPGNLNPIAIGLEVGRAEGF